ncbi:MAG: hypothetical protein QW304_07995 [Thermoproteota archaeon]
MKPLFNCANGFLISILLIMPLNILLLNPQSEYIYYGVVPGRIWYYETVSGTNDLSLGWRIVPATVTDHGYISILASQDGTWVRVYTLPDRQLVSEATLDSMQKHYVRLPNGTMFKIVSSKLVSVLLISPPPGGGIPGVNVTTGPIVAGFYSSVDGAYVGKEFVIETSQGLLGFLHTIFAVEDAEVTLTDEDGSTQSFKLNANTYRKLQPKPLKAYRITSTGNIMIQGGYMTINRKDMQRSFFVPSAEGGFIGRRFYSGVADLADEGSLTEENWFIISALEDTKVTVWDLYNQKAVEELNVKAGEQAYVRPTEIKVFQAIAFDSDKPVIVQFLHSGSIKWAGMGISYGAGLTYLGIRPNEDTPFVLPTNSTIYAYLFTSEDANIVVDDVPMTLRTDEPWVISTPGPHRVRSNKNLVLLLLHYPLIPPNQGIVFQSLENGFGVTVPCVQTVNVVPSVTLSPMAPSGFMLPTNYTSIIIILIIVIAAIVVLRRRKK